MNKYLIEQARAHNIALDDYAVERFERYTELLLEYNAKFNLTAIKEPQDIVVKHYIDSMLGASMIPNESYVVDVGSGAGFPAIPLAIIRPDLNFVLMDALNKRVGFLDVVIDELGLEDRVVAYHLRAEDADKFKHQFDVVVCRAVASIGKLAGYAKPLLKTKGKLIAYKAEKAEEELIECACALKKLDAVVTEIKVINLANLYDRKLIQIEFNQK